MRRYRRARRVVLVLAALVTILPGTSFALMIDFTLTGSPGACQAGASDIAGGCSLPIAGVYGDGVTETFQIFDADPSDLARVEFMQGAVDKVVLQGVVIGVLVPGLLTMTFSHVFDDLNPAGDVNAILGLSGAIFSSDVRTIGGTGSGAISPNPVANYSPALLTAQSAGFNSFSLVDNEALGTSPGSTTTLGGRIDIDATLATDEFVVALTMVNLAGAGIPPIGGGCAPLAGVFGCIDSDGDTFLDTRVPLENLNNTPSPNQIPGAPIPEPSTVLLLGSGLAALAGMKRKYRARTVTQTISS